MKDSKSLPNDDPMLKKIIHWVNQQELIQVAILSGSRAEGVDDSLSDYDIALFTKDIEPYSEDNRWLKQIAEPWVCVNESLQYYNLKISTRLVIFEGGIKVDFSLFPLNALQEFCDKGLPEDFNQCYHLLVDKKNYAKELPDPTGMSFQQSPPTEEEFLRVVEEFWFEVYHVAKYLARGDQWSVKFREHGLKQEFLLQMIRWHTQSLHQWDYKTHSLGKNMHKWADKEILNALTKCYARFESEDCWRALDQTTFLFRRLAFQLSDQLGYQYPQKLDENITAYCSKLKVKFS